MSNLRYVNILDRKVRVINYVVNNVKKEFVYTHTLQQAEAADKKLSFFLSLNLFT